MCQAIDEMMADSREDGMKEGMEKVGLKLCQTY